MDRKPLVSIIIPVYNVEMYLEECLESICGQSYRELDIILVDDGSNDDSGRICDVWEQKDTRIRVVHKKRDGKDNGLSAARNTGLDMMKGDYVAFVDSDDKLDPEFVATLYKAITGEKQPDVVVCAYRRLIEQPDGTFLLKESVMKPQNRLMSGAEVLQERFSSLRLYYVIATNKLYRREIFENLRYEKGMMFEDELMLRPLFSSCQRVLCLTDALYYYRNRKNSIITTQSPKKAYCALEWINREIEYYRMHKEEQLLYQAEQMYCHDYLIYRTYLDPKDKERQKRQMQAAMKHLVRGRQVPKKTRIKYGIIRLFPFLYS